MRWLGAGADVACAVLCCAVRCCALQRTVQALALLYVSTPLVLYPGLVFQIYTPFPSAR